VPEVDTFLPAEVVVIDALAKTEKISPVARQAYINRLGHPLTEGEIERARNDIALDARRKREAGL
jgi:hypothetical protein